MQFGKQILEFLAIVVSISFLLSFLGVYGTGTLPMHQRLFFWGATVTTGALSGYLIGPTLWKGRFSGLHGSLKILAIAVAVSLPVTLVLFALSGWPSNLPHIIAQFGYVLIISLVISTGMYAADRLKSQNADSEDTANPISDFLQRLPLKYHRADLYAISSEDHYLRVYTNLGEELILLRLSDALKELSGADGLQVHRSWWVAKAGVADTKRDKDRLLLVLHSGSEVPVSRAFRANAKAAGLSA